MIDRNLKKIAKFLIDNNYTVATAESCTGGLLSSRFTDISGSSGFVKQNFVTYANEAKTQILGVSQNILEKYGAVSEECAYAMVKGLHGKTGCDLGICTTGIAGPTGGTKEKPVGLVYVSVYFQDNIHVKKFNFPKYIPRKLMKFLFTQAAIEFTREIMSL